MDVATKASRVWADILNVGKRCPNLVTFFKDNVRVKVGDGKCTSFWYDSWLGNRVLREGFARLFFLTIDKRESVASMVVKKEERGDWIFKFRRRLRIWESEELENLRQTLALAPMLVDGRSDEVCWEGAGLGLFTVRLAYEWWVSHGRVKSDMWKIYLEQAGSSSSSMLQLGCGVE